jgi:3-oxoacyl-[acyl-carrier protein] reductase
MLAIDLSGRLAIITGGSGEIGRVLVRTLAQAGAGVVVHYHRNLEQARRLSHEAQVMGRPAMVAQADVTRLESIQAMRDAIVGELGHPDILVNNAVIQYEWRHVLEQAPEDYEGQFRSCVLHNVFMAQAFVPDMVQKKWGRVIGINTECAMQNAPRQSAYVSGKRGMDGVLRVLAREVGEHGVTVNQVAPGWTISENHPDNDAQESYRQNVPLRRRGTAQEVANVVAFLASDLASFITGAYVPVCGGNVMPAI